MKRNKLFRPAFALLFVISLLSFLLFGVSCSKSGAQTAWRTGIVTSVSLSLSFGNGRVSATARNDLTVGFATVEVYVYLYSCETYPSSEEEMTKRATAHSSDLNIFCSLSAHADTNGGQGYWVARLRYKSNEQTWSEVSTTPVFVDGRA